MNHTVQQDQDLASALARLSKAHWEDSIAASAAAAAKTELAQAEVDVRVCLETLGLSRVTHGDLEIERVNKVVYNINAAQWPDLYKYITATGEFDLLQKRLSSTAVAERFKAGVDLPGVGRVELPVLRITKARVKI